VELLEFLGKLEKAKQVGEGRYKALCPAHKDREESLSITSDKEKILVHCFAGCTPEAIVKSLNLDMKDLFFAHKVKVEHREIETIYKYISAEGKPFEVVRTKPKGFYQRRPDGKGGYINNLRGITPTLYHQDDVLRAIGNKAIIYIVEGEKDCDNLRDIGLVATTNPMGAGKWRDIYSKTLTAANLVIIPDNDGPGRAHAEKVAGSCHGKAAMVRILSLADAKDVSDWLSSGHTASELVELVNTAPEYKPAHPDLIEIMVTDRHLRDITADALYCLYRANDPVYLFRRNGVLTRINLDEQGRPYTEMLNESAFRGCLDRVCNFIRASSKNGVLPISPPVDVVRDCLSLGDWQFPALLGITETPVMRPDGTVFSQPGYDHLTKLYYYPSPKLVLPPISDKPTTEDVEVAIELVMEPLADFPFDGDASLANAMGTLFTPILRPMIDGPVPLALFDKPQQGTGASLLAEVISIIATGRAAAMMTAQKDDEGWRKAITSLLLKGQLVATIDNIEYDLSAPSLAAILTATTYQDRILGKSEIVQLANRTTWLATGNNIRLRGDLPRRCIWVRMDAKMARPWLRDKGKFKHPQLSDWVFKNRGAILSAILTIARAWVMAGMPESQGITMLGGYESYCQVIGGVLAFIGVKAFLANLESMYDQADTDTPQWECFLEAWGEYVGVEPATVAEVIGVLNANVEFKATLPDSLMGKDGRDYGRRLGNALARRNGVQYPNGLSIMKGDKKRHKVLTWKIGGLAKDDGAS
jgi:hypothetical protein